MNFQQLKERVQVRAAKTILSNVKQSDLETLSEKKRICMDSFISAIEAVDDLDWPTKRNWITYVFQTHKFLSDDQLDQFVKAMSEGCNDYEFIYFTNELNASQKQKLIQKLNIAPELKMMNPNSFLM